VLECEYIDLYIENLNPEEIMMNYRKINKDEDHELSEYHRMRHHLWPDHEENDLREEMMKILNGNTFYKNELSWTIFVAEREHGKFGGFIEITIYTKLDFVDSKPVGYIEGWYVDEDLRMSGVGSKLVDIAIKWTASQGCAEIASDVEEHNLISQEAHLKLGFKEAKKEEHCIFYKKTII
jgi:aminoglycoside 6'-N-acetyltransferase I